MSQLERLIYVSIANPNLTDRGVQRIVNMAHLRNQMAQITGLLIKDGDYFLQLLEGPSFEVAATFKRISQDRRHESCQLLLKEPIEERAFSKMSMVYAGCEPLMSEAAMDLLDVKAICAAASKKPGCCENRALRTLLSDLLQRLKVRRAA
ncbi:BLUF domain-containing protein [Hyphomonas sp. FCG-A18]|uniref:BLUF domain-containing protein n=1 Tax=Hyphomonas sp. FCG-A18 TaxID=3080019 RepID=UPI002B2E68FF|nr:BLUF domain-containing protein [Hyphomonas sp. FCG-A18]